MQIAQFLVADKDYEAASAIYDEQEKRWADNPIKLQELKTWRADLDFTRGDLDSAVKKLSEIIALPLPEDPAEYGQAHNILCIAPDWLASYYIRHEKEIAAIDLLWKNIDRTLEWETQHANEMSFSGSIISNLNIISSCELKKGLISTEEARKRLDEMVPQIKTQSPDYSKSWNNMAAHVTGGRRLIKKYEGNN